MFKSNINIHAATIDYLTATLIPSLVFQATIYYQSLAFIQATA